MTPDASLELMYARVECFVILAVSVCIWSCLWYYTMIDPFWKKIRSRRLKKKEGEQ